MIRNLPIRLTLVVGLAVATLGVVVRARVIPIEQSQASAGGSAISYSRMDACPVTDHLIYSAQLDADSAAICDQFVTTRLQFFALSDDDYDTRPGLLASLESMIDQLGLSGYVGFYDSAQRQGRLQCHEQGAIYTSAYVPNDRNYNTYLIDKQFCQPGLHAGEYFHFLYYRCAKCPLTPLSVSAPPAATLSESRDPNSGAMTLTGHGGPGVSYAIQATSSLADVSSWTKIGVAIADSSGNFTFVDNDAPNYSSRFYRSVGYQP